MRYPHNTHFYRNVVEIRLYYVFLTLFIDKDIVLQKIHEFTVIKRTSVKELIFKL